ncbi:MAG: efflux RND transporter periplasmic adaptor subunit, partial [Eubacteriales bacterium]|nr:efflux RND transporter periplasmic adaptor subunit [Eubacteriales bacterium]
RFGHAGKGDGRMPDQKQRRKKTVLRILKTLLALAIVGVIALAGWIYLIPMVTADAVTVYDSYTVGTGDINTYKSFSASLSVKKDESFSSEEESTVKEIYVQSGDEVSSGDPLILMSTGELFNASFDGVVNEIRVEVGDWVWPNRTVVEVCDLKHLEVSMNVDEYDIEQLSLGQECTVSVISLSTDFETTIAHINRVSQSMGSVAFYTVTCDLTVPENVLPGMQATVTMPADAVTNVTTLDMAALAFDEDNNPYVLLKQDDGTYTKQTVETGLSDGMQVEITDGLVSGQTVYTVAGSESVKATITLEDIYRMIFGEKIVINDMSRRGGLGGGMQSGTDGEMPQMGDMPTWDGTDAANGGAMPQAGDATDGTAAAQDAATPQGTDATSDAQQTGVTAEPTAEATADTTDAQAAGPTGDEGNTQEFGGTPPSGGKEAPSGGEPATSTTSLEEGSVNAE